MKRCPKCTTQNTTTSIYCEICGTNLNISLTNVDWFDPTATNARNIPPPPPPSALNPYPTTEFIHPYPTTEFFSPHPGTDPINPYSTTDSNNPYSTIVDLDQQDFAAKPQVPTPGKGFTLVINMLLSSILYLIGAVWIAFGFAMTLDSINTTLSSPSFFLSMLINILVLITILILTMRHARSPRLHWWQRLLWIGAIFASSIIAFIILADAITMPKDFVLSDALTEQILGPVLLLSGIAIEFIAFR